MRSIRASERRIYQQITDVFAESVNKFLAFNEYHILEGHDTVKRTSADAKALTKYEKYNKQQRIESDFDRSVKKLLAKKDAVQ